MLNFRSVLIGGVAGFLIAAQAPLILPGPERSPALYRVLYEDESVRLVDYRLKPGENEPLHSHCAGVVYNLESSTVRSTTPEGVVSETAGKAGVARGRNAMAHALENMGATDVHALSFEIKARCK